MHLVTAREMQAIDRRTIDGGHVASLDLMENAGRAVAEAALALLPVPAGSRLEIFCGKGNNGGDGLVAARILAEHDVQVRVHLTHAASSMSDDARANLARLDGRKILLQPLPEAIEDPGRIDDPRLRPRVVAASPPDALAAAVHEADLCIDALLGTGATSDLQGRLAALVNLVNRWSRHTLAVDVPTGVDGDTGRVCGTAIWADLTVTLGLPKLGLALFPGRERAGRLEVADIGIPGDIVAELGPRRAYVDAGLAASLVPRLEPTAHKYRRGCVLVVAGSADFPGAAALAAEAALRAGAGIVHLAAPAPIRALLQAKLTEVIVHGLAAGEDGRLAPGALDATPAWIERADAAVVGPGLGDTPATLEAAGRFLRRFAKPAVVDADAVGVLAATSHPGPRLATPHAGELARWLGVERVEEADRARVALETAAARNVHVVAKGAPAFVATPAGQLYVNGSGNAGLGTAGSGDVLAGMLGGLLAQGLGAEAAAALGVYLHGRAADVAVRRGSPRSLVARDLLGALGEVWAEVE